MRLTKVTKLKTKESTKLFRTRNGGANFIWFYKMVNAYQRWFLNSDTKWRKFMKDAHICEACMNHTAHTILIICLLFCSTAHASTGKASYYTLKSVKAEGNSGITASGEKFNEDSFTAAMRSYRFGQQYKVTNLSNGRYVIVRHNDYGPSKAVSERGVIIDLSKAAFEKIADIGIGIINVRVEGVNS